jgi:hypothetical protein
MKTYVLFFFLTSGVWYPGWMFDGWAPAEFKESEDTTKPAIVRCLQKKTEFDSAQASNKGPYTFPGIKGNVDRVHVKCIQVVFPAQGERGS